jgi:hypothetical protein
MRGRGVSLGQKLSSVHAAIKNLCYAARDGILILPNVGNLFTFTASSFALLDLTIFMEEL